MSLKLGWRVWVLIIAILLSILAIRPSFESGILIKSVELNSSAFESGLREGQAIKSINGEKIADKEAYAGFMEKIFVGNESRRIDIATDDGEYILFINNPPQINVDSIPLTKIQTGLDLRGGARALVEAETPLSDNELNDLIATSQNRFNTYGVKDIQIKAVKDLSGNKFMLVEVAGATPADLEDLIVKQGKFEAKIANQTVFIGGNKDIVDVCRNDATCAAVTSCSRIEGGYACNFQFSIYLSTEAAKRQADITSVIPDDPSTAGQYLQEDLFLYLDDVEVDRLRISSGLKGRETPQISIQGSGQGATEQEALEDAKNSMNKLQTILITGSLPFKLHIVKLDTISPALGKDFIEVILLAGVSAIILVSIIIFVRYRKIKISLALLLTSFSELVIILGLAAMLKWNLDLPSIAGILATIGTGVDSQIIILDETRKNISISLSAKMKRALFIVFSSFFTAVVAMLPLLSAGAGLFKGFALTTIAGITAGVLISRPAFAEIIRKIEGGQ